MVAMGLGRKGKCLDNGCRWAEVSCSRKTDMKGPSEVRSTWESQGSLMGCAHGFHTKDEGCVEPREQVLTQWEKEPFQVQA